MESIKKIYKIGFGPSSSHTMGPHYAGEIFRKKNPSAHHFEVTLYASLALTGKGHLTDVVLVKLFGKDKLTIKWEPEKSHPYHPNGMKFRAYDNFKNITDEWVVYSVGGGEINDGVQHNNNRNIYPEQTLAGILAICERDGISLWEYVVRHEEEGLFDYLQTIWAVMKEAIQSGLETEGVLPGGLGLSRKAMSYYMKAQMSGDHYKKRSLLSSYALAVAEENAAGGKIVTAPTCGSAGVLPAILYYMEQIIRVNEKSILRALATAGLIGNLIKTNASISGAKVGCQGEIGSACSMAAAAASQLFAGTPRQIEYAAEMGMEHHLGLTCDPVRGYVQIPCIERNSFAAKRALDCADHANFSDGSHRISFDKVISVMKKTGHDLPSLYRETSEGGLASAYEEKFG